jgi:hypothetical protein
VQLGLRKTKNPKTLKPSSLKLGAILFCKGALFDFCFSLVAVAKHNPASRPSSLYSKITSLFSHTTMAGSRVFVLRFQAHISGFRI